jgi:hypothetical protein
MGHYSQIIALQQGLSALQRDLWGITNSLMIIVGFVCAAIEVYRVSRRNSAHR